MGFKLTKNSRFSPTTLQGRTFTYEDRYPIHNPNGRKGKKKEETNKD